MYWQLIMISLHVYNSSVRLLTPLPGLKSMTTAVAARKALAKSQESC